MKENVVKWNIKENINTSPVVYQHAYIKNLSQDNKGLYVLVELKSSEDKLLKMTFGSRQSYRNIDEGDYVCGLDYELYDFPKAFYMKENSEYIKWFQEVNCGKDWEIKHYCIYTPIECLDILSTCEPTIEWLKGV